MSEIHAANLPRLRWMRVIAGGAIWAAVYNLVWGVACFAFMRREWHEAFAAINRPLLFTADTWIFWIALTLPIGVAIAAYAANPARSVSAPKATAYAGITLWLVMSIGMATWSWQNSLSIHIIALDSAVNLVAMLVPASFAAWKDFYGTLGWRLDADFASGEDYRVIQFTPLAPDARLSSARTSPRRCPAPPRACT